MNTPFFSEPHAAVKYLLWALTNESEHHKQWAIEQAFRSLCTDEYVDKAKAKFRRRMAEHGIYIESPNERAA